MRCVEIAVDSAFGCHLQRLVNLKAQWGCHTSGKASPDERKGRYSLESKSREGVTMS
jgi:hypothetical protein